MKIKLTFKTPDVTGDIKDNFPEHCEVHEEYDFGCTACIDHKLEAKEEIQSIKSQLGKFIQYDEYITVEFDLNAGTATVVPLK